MHGLINKAIQAFLTQTYGDAFWQRVAADADIGLTEFEAMLTYDPALTDRVLDAACRALDRDRGGMMEDLGTFLVTSPSLPGIRRLLRFCGVTFEDFVHSLDDLPDRVQLAVSDLHLPRIEVTDAADQSWRVLCAPGLPGYGHVILGLLRAMADDYGALALLDLEEDGAITVDLIDSGYADGRSFRLSMGVA